jgi:hypothetical protein
MDDQQLNERFDRLHHADERLESLVRSETGKLHEADERLELLVRAEADERRGADAHLGRRFDQLETLVRSETASLHEADERLESLIRSETAKLHEEAAETREYVDLRITAQQETIIAEGATTRRHFDIVAEDLKQAIRTIAEGHGALRAGQERLERRQDRLEFRQENPQR